MASPTLAALTAQVKESTDVEASAVIALNGAAARQQAAIDEALRLGATEAQMALAQEEVNLLKASAASLAAAVVANTPAA